jgi:hypothetical protein
MATPDVKVNLELIAGLAQLAEQAVCNRQAVGSSPTPGSDYG